LASLQKNNTESLKMASLQSKYHYLQYTIHVR
jgi:hypothetical protein